VKAVVSTRSSDRTQVVVWYMSKDYAGQIVLRAFNHLIRSSQLAKYDSHLSSLQPLVFLWLVQCLKNIRHPQKCRMQSFRVLEAQKH
jgi:hypothetical protein